MEANYSKVFVQKSRILHDFYVSKQNLRTQLKRALEMIDSGNEIELLLNKQEKGIQEAFEDFMGDFQLYDIVTSEKGML